MNGQSEYLIGRASAEGAARPDYFMHLQVPLPVLIALTGHLQIALRAIRDAQANHRNPEAHQLYSTLVNPRGAASQLVRDSIEQIIQRLKDDHFFYNAKFLEHQQERAESEPGR